MDNAISTYLIDTNSLITPYKRYYPFDLAPPFWKSMEEKLKDGNIVLLDKVYNEVTAGDDELTEWLSGIEYINVVSHKNVEMVKKYSEILSYVQTCGFYKQKALAEWSDAKVADAWIVACAIVQNHTVVTFEEPNGNLNKNYPCSRAKIPEICDVFGIEYTNLFEMMRQLSFNVM
ncbi:MAG: DUF4411 family protein [Oscillospiraceae bacterium]|jgi:hypothetical protein|nr:DUF4411 family protein [Oscillospiraceae bacterium]